jgi:hypothetical protein
MEIISPKKEKSPAVRGAFFGKRRKRRKEDVIHDFHCEVSVNNDHIITDQKAFDKVIITKIV